MPKIAFIGAGSYGHKASAAEGALSERVRELPEDARRRGFPSPKPAFAVT